MTAIKATFDGKQIITPPELLGAPPSEVVILVENQLPARKTHSVMEVIGTGHPQLSAEEIDAIIKEERDGWGDR